MGATTPTPPPPIEITCTKNICEQLKENLLKIVGG